MSNINTQSSTRYYTPDEVSEILQVGRFTVYRWLRNGSLKGLKISGLEWRITKEDFDEFIAQGYKRAADRHQLDQSNQTK